LAQNKLGFKFSWGPKPRVSQVWVLANPSFPKLGKGFSSKGGFLCLNPKQTLDFILSIGFQKQRPKFNQPGLFPEPVILNVLEAFRNYFMISPFVIYIFPNIIWPLARGILGNRHLLF